MKSWKLIVIPILLVILAVGVAFAINAINWWWDDTHNYPGKRASLEVEMQGVADWAKAEQDLDLLGEYAFVTTPKIDKEQIKKVYTYHLSDGSVFGHFIYQKKQQEQHGTCSGYAKDLVEAEAAHLGKEYYFDTGGFFAISDDPIIFWGHFVRCTEGCYYRE